MPSKFLINRLRVTSLSQASSVFLQTLAGRRLIISMLSFYKIQKLCQIVFYFSRRVERDHASRLLHHFDRLQIGRF